MFCPFIKDECRTDCVFRCNPRSGSSSMYHEVLHCLIASRLDAMNTQQEDQLSELIDTVRNSY